MDHEKDRDGDDWRQSDGRKKKKEQEVHEVVREQAIVL